MRSRLATLLVITSCALLGSTEGAAQSFPLNKVIVVDDFNDGSKPNNLMGATAGDEEHPGGCIPSLKGPGGEAVFGGKGYSLQLEYDVEMPDSFSFYSSQMGPAFDAPSTGEENSDFVREVHKVKTLDVSGYQYLSFWILTEEVSPKFSIEVHEDSDGDSMFILGKDMSDKVSVARFVIGEDPARWRKVAIPFSRFRRISNWDRIVEVVLLFENRMQSGRGTVQTDDVLFGSNFPDTLGLPEPYAIDDVQGDLTLNGGRLSSGVKAGPENDLLLTLTKGHPYLERVAIEVSQDGGKTWKVQQSFYEHPEPLEYRTRWEVPSGATSRTVYTVRAVVDNVWGHEVVVAGPHFVTV